MLVTIAAAAGVLAAGACCATPSRIRARILAVIMALACLVPLSAHLRLAAAAMLIIAAMVLAVGARRRDSGQRASDVHRGVGAVLMAAMLMLGDHAGGNVSDAGGHAHPMMLSPHAMLAVAAAGYLVWTLVVVSRPAHRVAGAHRGLVVRTAARVEPAAMAAMFALLLPAMVSV